MTCLISDWIWEFQRSETKTHKVFDLLKNCYESIQLVRAKSQIHIHSTHIWFRMNTTSEQSITPIISEAPIVSEATSN